MVIQILHQIVLQILFYIILLQHIMLCVITLLIGFVEVEERQLLDYLLKPELDARVHPAVQELRVRRIPAHRRALRAPAAFAHIPM